MDSLPYETIWYVGASWPRRTIDPGFFPLCWRGVQRQPLLFALPGEAWVWIPPENS